LLLDDPVSLGQPVSLGKPRPLAFIHTNWGKLRSAQTINDLFHEGPLEEAFWRELKARDIPAERQWPEKIDGRRYFLDFALFCEKRNIDIETDGDSYHANPVKAAQDNRRNNDLESRGWSVLRFSSSQMEQEPERAIHVLAEAIETYGGLLEPWLAPRRFVPTPGGLAIQLALREERSEYGSVWEDEDSLD
jgi:very-short-patch-repair endonuclease